jgi:hypothetical protein
MRQDINPKTRRVTRQIVDGQQRLRTVLSFLEDGFPILKVHNEEYGGKRFSELEEETQREILKYEFVVDLLQDMPDQEVYDIFARLNTYSVILNAQELRNASYFGEFKTTVYTLSGEFMTFWQINMIFPDKKILRMAEAEFVSELLIAMSVGIRARSRPLIDNFYDTRDDEFANRETLMKRFRKTMDTIGGIMGTNFTASKFSEARLLYPLFCSVYHLQFGLPDMECEQRSFKQSDYPKLRVALEKVDEIFKKLEEEEERRQRIEAEETVEEVPREEVNEEAIMDLDPLTSEERRFYDAYSVHWIHAENRRIRTRYICRLMVDALG